MSKIVLVAVSTFRRRVRSGTFLVLTLGIPTLMVIAGAIPFLQAGFNRELPILGVVDHTGNLAGIDAIPVEGGQVLHVVMFSDVPVAQRAFDGDEISGYLVIPKDYPDETAQPTYFGNEQPSFALEDVMNALLVRVLLPKAESWVYERIADPSAITYVVPQHNEVAEEGPALILRFAFPAILALVFAIVLFTGANQLGPVVVQEKEQRAMEMVITSIAPWQLVSGKILGMTLLSLTQLAVWAVGGMIALVLALQGELGAVWANVPWGVVAWAMAVGIPGYFLFAVVAAGLGIIAGDSRQARQLAGGLGLIALAPLWFAGALVAAPDGPIAILLTLFPLTSPIFSLFRMTFTTVPAWQLASALGLILISLVAGLWAVARLFRAAMLLYGQSLRPQGIWRALRQA